LLDLNKEYYFIIIINKGSHVAWVYNIKNKSDIYNILLDFFKLINIQFNLNNNINNNNLFNYIKIIKLNNTIEFKFIK
jgi:hypothetical protein